MHDLEFGSVVIPPACVEEFGVAFVVEAADDSAVADLLEAAFLEDTLHSYVVGQGRTAYDLETHNVEAIDEEEIHGLAGVAATPRPFIAYLYAELAALVAKIVEGGEPYRLPGLDDKGLDGGV